MTRSRKSIGDSQFRLSAFSDSAQDAGVRCLIALQICAGAVLNRTRPSGPRDRGDVLTNVVFTVGLVIIAGLVLAVLKTKASTVTNNICTNADPTTC